MTTLLARHATSPVTEALADTRVVSVVGARQVGKSTLVRGLMRARKNAAMRNLDVATELAAARADPTRFVRHQGLLSIDEVQRAPELLLAIKAAVDEDPRPGQFLLTGSARLLGLRDLPDALVGRMETVELWPLSQGEIEHLRDDFTARVFADEPSLSATGESREETVERAMRGGFPEAVKRVDDRRARFFQSYLSDLIDRDVRQLAELQRHDELRRLVSLLAGRTAQLLKVEAIASSAGVPATTLARYLALFEEVFLLKRIPAWSGSARGRAVRMRKLLFVDSGLAAHAAGWSLRRLAREEPSVGALVENFVLGELARQLGWSTQRASLFHYRTRDGVEIDAVLEADDGRIVGVEVKTGETVRSDDFSHLRRLQSVAGARFHLGVVLHSGRSTVPFGPRLVAAPISTLWAKAH